VSPQPRKGTGLYVQAGIHSFIHSCYTCSRSSFEQRQPIPSRYTQLNRSPRQVQTSNMQPMCIQGPKFQACTNKSPPKLQTPNAAPSPKHPHPKLRQPVTETFIAGCCQRKGQKENTQHKQHNVFVVMCGVHSSQQVITTGL
jgi:hypothetical protein